VGAAGARTAKVKSSRSRRITSPCRPRPP
jgi:hypothetical protein